MDDSRITIGRGPRALEDRLLAELAGLADGVRRDRRLLARPVRVVVPSRSLAQHLSAALVRQVGRAVAGVRIQTLHGLALEVLDAADEPAPRGDDLFGVFVRRAARGEPALRAALEGLEDGYGAVTGAVADLLDAGFRFDVEAHREAVEQALGEANLPSATRERVSGLARVATSAAAALAERGLGRRGVRLARAAELLVDDPTLLPARAWLVHGFADATGVASDLLQVVMGLDDARLFLDHPPDPAHLDERDLGAAFTRRLLDRIAPNAGSDPSCAEAGAARLGALRASGTDAEVRAVADRIHALLEDGVPAESIAIVARDLGRLAIPIRTHLGRLGIAFSGQAAAGPPTGRGRKVHALLDLLVQRQVTTAERWLEVLAVGRGQRADLRLGFHAAGAARLSDVAGLAPGSLLRGKKGLPLPARRGLARAKEGAEGEMGPQAHRRVLSGGLLTETVARAAKLVGLLGSWPATASVAAHLDNLRELFVGHLDWRHGEERQTLERACAALSGELPDAGLELSYDEFVLVLGRLLRGAADEPLGGAGAGVQVLSVVEARARTFEHLFLLGMNRDSFPRPLTEDPLLPDSVRASLEAVLPEIPIKARGFEEEHYLFAQLLAAGAQVTLSWQTADDEGKARSPSPFIDRLKSAGRIVEVEEAPTLQAPPDRSVGRPRTAAEAAVAEALYGGPRRFAELLPLVIEERRRFDPLEPPRTLAAARLAVLGELGQGAHSKQLGPYFGFVGPALLAEDLRNRPVYITHLESLVRCPWEFFLKRLLGLEPAPNALDSLPHVSPLLLGNVVHRVLERIVDECREDDDGLGELAGTAVVWPEREHLEQLLEETAAELLASEGIGPPAFARVVVEAARPFLAQARELEWPAPGSAVRCQGAERQADLQLSGFGGAGRSIQFRADRVDRIDGNARYIDYKTGSRIPSTKSKPREGLLARVAGGAFLQAPAYALSSGGEGRYLFLHPDAEVSVYSVSAEDADFRAAFEGAVKVALRGLDGGAFVPRLTDAEGSGPHANCKWCEVHEACLQGDAGARGRLASWTARGHADSAAEAAGLELWRLPERKPE